MDRELVDRARRGDRDAFARLVHEVSDRLYALAYRILRDPDLAQDAFQEALISSWRQLPSLRDADRFEAWLRRILVHACYAESRKRTRWNANVRTLEVEDYTPTDPDHSVLDRDVLERAFVRLPFEHRVVFVLHHHVGLPLVDIAETLGIPDGTARSRLHYATRALREALERLDETPATAERLA